MEFVKKNLVPIAVVGATLVVFIICLFLPAALAKEGSVSYVVNLSSLVFGGGKLMMKESGFSGSMALFGGISYAGIISFVVMILGVAGIVCSLFVKDAKIANVARLAGYCALVVSGILAFLLLTGGSEINTEITAGDEEGGLPFKAFYGEELDFKLGAGAIVYGVVSILAGVCGVAMKYATKLLNK